MIRLRLAQLGKEAPEKYWGADTTLVFVEGYHGVMVREGEWLALELRDGILLRWIDTGNLDNIKHQIFKYLPPQKILIGIKTTLIGSGQVTWKDGTDQSYRGYSSERYFGFMIFDDKAFERALFKFVHHIKEIPDAIRVTDKIDI